MEQSAPFVKVVIMVFVVNKNIWRIEFVNPYSDNLVMSNGNRVLGLCDNNIKTIFIANNQSDYKTEHILCHEVTHAICMEYNITIPYGLEEELCNFMADYGKEIIYIVEDIISAITKKRAV